jgi:hypothetical protein
MLNFCFQYINVKVLEYDGNIVVKKIIHTCVHFLMTLEWHLVDASKYL